MKLQDQHKSLANKLAFLAIFGITGAAALIAYKYAKKQLDFDIDWDDVWKDLK